MELDKRIRELIAKHGTLRAVARHTGIDVGYLSRLERREKTEPSDEMLARLGLRRVVTYRRVKEPTNG